VFALNQTRTQVHRQSGTLHPVHGFSTGISLHSHTRHSKETLDFLPHYIDFHQIPVVSRLIRSQIKKYQERTGKTVDFRCAYWTPPMTPAQVLASETAQIEQKLGMRAFVSITDHDTIEGPVALRKHAATSATPISVEWTIPFGENAFHLGVHQIPADRAPELMMQMASYTAHPSEELLCELLSVLDGFAETLIVLNHPFCNFVRVPAAQHWSSLQAFLAQCGNWIHALELNGMRPWTENEMVPGLAEEYSLPVIAGGDRHGCDPNTMLNLTTAESFSEFVNQVRNEHRNYVLVLPEYEEPVRIRELATAGDVVRRYPQNPPGQRRFTDRIFAEVEGYSWHPLSFYWDGSDANPRWLYPLVAGVVGLSSKRIRPVLRLMLSLPGEYDRVKAKKVREYSSETSVSEMGCYPR
jgi:hypothetical protein